MTRATKIELRLALFFAAVLGGYFLVAYQIARSQGLAHIFWQEGVFDAQLLRLCSAFLVLLPIFYFMDVIRRGRVAGFSAAIKQDVDKHLLSPDRVIARLTVFAVWFFTISIFMPLKFFIGRTAQGFSYDKTFADWDRVLFFGHDAWQITHGLFGTPLATALFEACYVFWFFLMWGSILLCIAKPDMFRLRAQFMVAFMLSWIVIGSVAAFGLASAGPCFYQHIFGDPHFAPLMTRLEQLRPQVPGGMFSLELQNYPWNGFAHRSTNFGMGLSAMPSMHVAIAVLMALGAFRIGRLLGVLMTVFALLIWIGSIHLGWHYAVDGIVATFMMLAVWAFAGFVVRKIEAVSSGEIAPLDAELEPAQIA